MNFNKISEGFGKRVLDLLRKKGVSQKQFSKDTGTLQSLTSRYINSDSPSGDFILKAVAYFPEDVNYLFFGEKGLSVNEDGETYLKQPEVIINEIESKLKELKASLSRK